MYARLCLAAPLLAGFVASPQELAAQSPSRVSVITTSDLDARELLGPVVAVVRTELQASPAVERMEHVRHEVWRNIEQHAQAEAYFRRYNIRYVVLAELEQLEAQRVRYVFTLTDRNRPRRPLYQVDGVVRPDPETFRPMLQKVAADLRAAVEGRPARPMIFTYCFMAHGGDGQLGRMAESLPADLRYQMRSLRQIQQAYEVTSFSSDGLRAMECRNPTVENVAYSDYVILGDLAQDTRGFEVVVRVRRRGRDTAALDRFAPARGRALAPQLADHILRHWSRVR